MVFALKISKTSNNNADYSLNLEDPAEEGNPGLCAW